MGRNWRLVHRPQCPHEIRPDIPVIFMTGYAGENALEPLASGEAADVFPKPFGVTDLLRRVTDGLASGAPKASDDGSASPFD